MAIKISDTVVIDDSRNASNLASVSAASSVTASAFYGDGSNLENTGATLNSTSGVERLVTTQLSSGTMVNAATDVTLPIMLLQIHSQHQILMLELVLLFMAVLALLVLPHSMVMDLT